MEKVSQFPSSEAIIGRINAAESRVQWIDRQLESLGPFRFLKKRNLRRIKNEDQMAIKRLMDQTSTISITDILKDR